MATSVTYLDGKFLGNRISKSGCSLFVCWETVVHANQKRGMCIFYIPPWSDKVQPSRWTCDNVITEDRSGQQDETTTIQIGVQRCWMVLPVIIMCWEKGKLMQLQQQLILSRSLQVSLRAWDCFILPQAILEVSRQQISWIYQAFLGCRLEQSFQANVSWTLCWPGWFVPPDDLCFESNPHMGWAGGAAWGSTSGCLHWNP